jgi:toxin ParE1/3/4
MSAKPVVPREEAHRDVDEALAYYFRQGGPDLALGFIDALEQSYAAIAEHPGIGSPRYAHELDLPGLRHRALGRFPYVAFYIERDDRIDVWRVLDSRRDIPASLQDME